MSRRRVLFIDDDPRILEGIARLLRPKRAQVEVLTAVGGAEALALLAREGVDVVISDMRMPLMDGAQLLSEVRNRYPQIVRIILSGQSDHETILRAVGPAHQFLSKPCDPEMLTATTLRACALRDLLSDGEQQRIVASLSGLPCCPSALAQIRAELSNPIVDIVRVGELVAGDLGLSSKVIQLTATSFFGTPRGVITPRQAVECLGPDVMRRLAHGDVAFPACDVDVDPTASDRARRRGEMSRCLAARLAPEHAAAAEVAGLLARCGELLGLAITAAPGSVLRYGDVAAFLIGLWGLPDVIVEVVQRHADPKLREGKHDLLCAVVHAAAVQVDGIPADEALLASHGITPGLCTDKPGLVGME
jgi:DNA-binding NarL/FixJ family response regulator